MSKAERLTHNFIFSRGREYGIGAKRITPELRAALQACECACFERYPFDYKYHNTPEETTMHIYSPIKAGTPEPPPPEEEDVLIKRGTEFLILTIEQKENIFYMGMEES